VITFDEHRLLAVVRYREACDLDAILDVLRAAEVTLLEVTAETPGALDAVARAARSGTPIGAGTIRAPAQAKAFASNGAAFLVSPGLTPGVAEAAAGAGIPFVPGALTPTEIAAALDAEAAAVKLFPASLGGPGYLRDLRGPFPDVPFVPTGGVAVDDVPAWLEAGAACVGLGSTLLGSTPPRTTRELDALGARARRAVELAGGAA
jgi:2-dehydro-3-deoxyphosphogluconate aldolase/(4S)-4-hydroxy-2-oxoglutarate aldolase